MAKYNASQMRELIREVVRSEIKSVVAETISEVLSDRYLRHLAESAAAAQPRGVANLHIQGDDEEPDEEVPHALENSILGVGEENLVFKKEPKDDGVQQFHEGEKRNEMLSLFFEGTRPINELERDAGYAAAADDDEEGVTVPGMPPAPPPPARPAAPARRPMTEVWQTLAGVKPTGDKPAAQAAPLSPEAREQFEEARLKRLREQLEVPVK